jgi:hypothetical protein
MKKSLHDYQNREGFFGGQGGIRTHEPLARLPDFEFFAPILLYRFFHICFRMFYPQKIRVNQGLLA